MTVVDTNGGLPITLTIDASAKNLLTFDVDTSPSVVSVTGDIVCDGTALSIGLDASELNVLYELFFNGALFMPAKTWPGTGFASANIWNETAVGVYTVKATNGNCPTVAMTGSAAVKALPADQVFAQTGTACSSGTVVLNNSESGVNYILQRNGVNLPIIEPGFTGSTITFPAQTIPGVYTVQAVYTALPNCPFVLSGSLTVVNPNDITLAALGNVTSYCQGSINSGITLYTNTSEIGNTYALRNISTSTDFGLPKAGTNGPLSWNDVPAGDYQVVTTSGTCTESSNTISVTAKALPTATISIDPMNDERCENTVVPGGFNVTVNFTGTAPFNYTIVDDAAIPNSYPFNSALNTDTRAFDPSSTTTYTVSTVTDATGCSNTASVGSATITVKKFSVAIVEDDSEVCENTTVKLNAVPNPNIAGGYSYSWDTAESTQAISVNPTVAANTYNVTVTSIPDGCVVSASKTITVNPLPVVSFSGLAPNYCFNDVSVTLAGSPVAPPGIGEFYLIKGVAAPVWLGGKIFDPSLVGDANNVVNGQVYYTYTDAKGCYNESSKQTVTVNPLPTPSIVNLDLNYCQDSPDVVVTGNPVGGTFTITGPAGLSYTAVPNSGTITISPSASTIGPIYNIHYTYSDISGCTTTVTEPTSIVNLSGGALTFSGLSAAYCQSDAAIYNINGLVNGAAVVSGQAVISGNGITQTPAQELTGEATFSPASAGVGSHTVTFTYTSSIGCTGVTTKTVVVGADLGLNGLSPAYCADEPASTIAVTLSGVPVVGGSGYFEVTPPTNPLYTVNSSSFVLDPATFAANETGNYQLKYVLPDSPIVGCVAIKTWSFAINPLPDATIKGLKDNYCLNDSPPSLLEQLNPMAGDVASFSGIGVSGNYFNAATAGVGTHIITTHVTSSAGCDNISTKSTNVVALPALGIVGLHNACETDASYTFTVSNAAAVGTFTFTCYSSIAGQNPLTHVGNSPSATFDPSVGEGVYIIKYSFEPDPMLGTGCSQTVSQTVTVHRNDPVDFGGLSASYCQNDSPVLLSGSFGAGTFTCSAPGNLGIADNSNGTATFDPSALSPGNYTITYAYTNSQGCVSTSIKPVQINAKPIVYTVTGGGAYCKGAAVGASVQLSGSENGVVYELLLNGLSLSPAVIITGAVGGGAITFTDVKGVGTYTVVALSPSGCSMAMTGNVVVSQSELTLVTSRINETCDYSNNGQASVFVSGGTTPYVYYWKNGGGTTVSTTDEALSLTAGNYTVDVTDASGCIANKTVVITEPAALANGFSTKNTTCDCSSSPANCDGEATALASGGTSPYTISWSTGQTGSAINKLGVGTYTVTVTDFNDCTLPSTFTIGTIGLPITVVEKMASHQNVNCFGLSNGQLEVNASGGTGNYEYSIDNINWVASPLFIDLAAGSYTVWARDAANAFCVFSIAAPIVISQPSLPLSLSELAHKNVTCFGSSDGQLEVVPDGGSGSYEYSIDNGTNWQASGKFIGLNSGIRYVWVRDANAPACIDKSLSAIDIDQPLPIDFTYSKSNLTCNASGDGAITLTPIGGNALTLWGYSIDNGATWQNSGTFGGLTSSLYNALVRDGQSPACVSGGKMIAVTEPAANGATLLAGSTIDVACYGESTGSFTLEAVPVGASLEYSITGAATRPWQTSPTFSNLPVGNYDVSVSQGACSKNNVLTVTINAPLGGLAISGSTVTNITCGANSSTGPTNNGSVLVNVSGGTAPYNYQWVDAVTNIPVSVANGGKSQQITNMPKGSYKVTVTDQGNCPVSATYIINQPDDWNVVFSKTNLTSVGANDGTISITSVSGGFAPYTISWSDGAAFDGLYGRSGLAVGPYSYPITDVNGCTYTQTIDIFDDTALRAAIDKSDVNCFGDATGNIQVAISNGVPVYDAVLTGLTYEGTTINQPKTNVTPISNFEKLKAGNYVVTVTDNNGGSYSSNVVINQPASAVTMTVTKTDVTCNGDQNGEINVTAVGGTPFIPGNYNFTIVPGASVVAPSHTFNLLNIGTYTVFASDDKGCIAPTVDVTIMQPNVLAVTVAAKDVRCNGGTDGTLTATVTGRNAGTPYQYDWETYSGGVWVSYLPNDNALVNGVPAGIYRSVVKCLTDGCKATSAPVTVSQNNVLAMDVVSKHVTTCYGDNSGSLYVEPYDGKAPYIFTYTGNATGTDSDTGPFEVFNLPAGSYNLEVKDANGCILNDVEVISQPVPVAVNNISHSIGCEDPTNGELNLTVDGGVVIGGNQQYYIWLQNKTVGTGYVKTPIIASGGSTVEQFTGLAPGHYELIVRDINSTDAVTCQFTYSFDLANISIAGDVVDATCLGINSGQINNVTISGAEPGYTFSWPSATGTGLNPSSLNQSNLSAGTYVLEVVDAVRGCTVNRSFDVAYDKVLSIDASKTNVSCNGGSDGSVIINNVAGTTGPVSYFWNGNATLGQPSFLTGLTASTQQLEVRDGNNCAVNETFIVDQPLPISYSLTTNLANANPYDRTITLSNLTGGNGTLSDFTYTYSGPGAATWQSPNLGGMDMAIPATPLLTGVTTGGVYNVTVYDQRNCPSPQSITIDGDMVLSTAVTHITCNGSASGSIILNVSGGSGSYSYSWTKLEDGAFNANTKDLLGITAGNYPVVVTDGVQGYTKTVTVTVNQPTAITISPTVKPVYCAGASEGEIALTVSGGTAPYTYAWATPNGSGLNPIMMNQTGLTAGTYNVTVTDANSCSVASSIPVTEPLPLSFNLVMTNRNCNGTGDLAIQNITGGSGNYQIVWTGPGITPAMQNQTVLTNLPKGTYVATIHDVIDDESKCSLPQSITIEGGIKVSSVVPTAQSCSSIPNGAININVSGGIAPLTYLWTIVSNGGGNFIATNLDQTGLLAGTYELTISDGAGCSVVVPNVVVPLTPSFSIQSTVVPDYCKASTGSIDVTVNPASPSYTYNWLGAGVVAASEDQANLAKGFYTVTVHDNSSGCDEIATIEVAGPALPLTVNLVSKTDVLCHGSNTGVISVSASGGTAPYTYSWTGPVSFAPGAVQTDLPAGDYSVVVEDANKCKSAPFNVSIDQPAAVLALSLNGVVHVANNGDATGQISLSATGGEGAYSLVWTGTDYLGNAISIANDNFMPTGLLAGVYDATVTDGNGCTAQLSNIVVRQPLDPFAILANGFDATPCNGAVNGRIVVTTIGGDSPYAIRLYNSLGALIGNQPVGNYEFTDLVPDIYLVEAEDGNGVVLSQNVTIKDPSPLVLNTLVTSNATCADGNDGEIEVTVNGGLPNSGGFYKVTVSGIGYYNEQTNVVGSAAALFSGLPAGSYLVRVVDDANKNGSFDTSTDCYKNQTVVITKPEAQVSISGNQTICKGDNAQLTFTVSNWANISANPLEVTLSNGNVVTVNSSPMFYSYIPAATEDVTITDVSVAGCKKGTGTGIASVTVNSRPTAVIVGDADICKGESSILQFYLTGQKPWTITYTDGAGIFTESGIQSTLHPVSVSPSASTTYTLLQVTDNVCSQTYLPSDPINQVDVTVNDLPLVVMTGTTTICNGTSTNLVFSFTSGTAPYEVVVDEVGVGEFTINNVNSSPYQFAVSPSRTTTYKLMSVKDANGCKVDAAGPVTVTVDPLSGEPGSISGDLTVCQGKTGRVYSIAPVANATSYVWEIPAGFNLVSGGNESVTIDIANNATTAPIRVYAVNGCGSSLTKSEIVVTVSPLPQKPINITCSYGHDICQGTTGIVFSVDEVLGAKSYQWQLPAGLIMKGAPDTRTILVDLDALQSNISGSVTVTAINDCDLGVASDAYVVNIKPLPIANAGSDQNVCGNLTILEASPALAGQIGSWQIVSGAAYIVDISMFDSQVINLAQGPTVLEWRVMDLTTRCYSVDQVTISNNQYPLTAWAGSYSTCNSQVSIHGTPIASVPGGTGMWSFTKGAGNIDDATKADAVVSNLSDNVSILKWTITHPSGCQSSAEVEVTNNKPSAAIITNKTAVADICSNDTILMVAAVLQGTGSWSVVKGSGSFSNATTTSVKVTNIGQGDNIYRWTVVKNGCSRVDEVTVRNNLLTVSAGPDITTCDDEINELQGSNHLNVDVNTVSNWYVANVGGIVQGSASFVDASKYNTKVLDLAATTNRLVWEINQKGCISRDTVDIISNKPTKAEVGVAYGLCADSAQLSANTPLAGDGYWSVMSGGGVFDDSTDPNTIVRGSKEGFNTYRWNIVKSGCFSSADLTVENKRVKINAGKDFAVCDNFTELNADVPEKGTGEWTVVPGFGAGSFLPNNKIHNPTVGGMQRGVNMFAWTVTNDGCATSDTMIVTNNATSIPRAGNGNEFINASTWTMQATAVGANEIGTWSIISGGATIDPNDIHNPYAEVTNLQKGPNVFRWTVQHLGCTSYAEITITNGGTTAANAGTDQDICLFEAQLQANDPGVGVGVWTIVKGFGVFDNNRSYQTMVRDLGPGENIFQWTIYYVNSSSFDDVSITNTTPTKAFAGPDRTICFDTWELEGNTPEEGDALWTLISGNANILNNNMPNATVSGLSNGLNIFKYEIKKLGCSSIDSVRITNDLPTVANAGNDVTLCTDSVQLKPNTPTFGVGQWRVVEGSANVQGNWALDLTPGVSKLVWQISTQSCHSIDTLVIHNNTPTAAFAGLDQPICTDTVKLQGNLAERGIGRWELLTGTGNILDPDDPQTIVRGIGRGSNRFRWVVDNKGCTTSDDVEISNNLIPSEAGLDQVICADSASLVASNPYPGTGTWGVLPGSGSGNVSFDKPQSSFGIVRNLENGDNILTWTVNYKGCQSVSSVSVTNNSPTKANAGKDQAQCSTLVVLGANQPKIGNGTWSLRNGGGTFDDATKPFATVSNLNFGTNIFRWTIENKGCESFDDVVIEENMVTATVGANQTNHCSSSALLQANNPSPGVGAWSIVGGSGQATFVNANDPNTTVNNLAFGANTLRWTINNQSCVSSAEMVITNNSPNTAYAGNNRDLCTNTVVLDATPVTVGQQGHWEVLSGTATIVDINNPKSTVSNLSKGDNVFRWRVQNGTCTNDDEVLIVNNEPSAPYAGSDEVVCSDSYQLKATSPEYGQGLWTIVSGAATIGKPDAAETTITTIGYGVNTFKWTVSKGQCQLSDNVTITNSSATIANAGADIQDCKDYATLQAGTTVNGSGTWSLVSGKATIVSPTTNTTNLTGLGFGENIFKWSIKNGNCISSDLVSVFNKMPDQSNAGTDKVICDDITDLAANNPVSGTGKWVVISGSGQFDTPTLYNTKVYNVGFGDNEYEWTIAYGQCSTKDVVTVTCHKAAPYAGDDAVVYTPEYKLMAGNPGTLSGQWSVIGGSGTFENASFFNTKVTGLRQGVNTFRWTIVVNNCPFYDDVSIAYKTAPTVDFMTDISVGCMPLEVQFTDYSVGGVSYFWDFGDGSTSTEHNPLHTYTDAGTFTVKLSVIGTDGVEATFSKQMVVNPLPVAGFSLSASSVFIPGGLVHYYNMSSGAKSYLWDFGDGGSSTSLNPLYEYKEVGTYDVSLLVINEHGCRDSLVQANAVEVIQQGFVSFPNAFTPKPVGSATNGVGNEVFMPKYKDVDEYHLQIFDRWGQLIFESHDITVGWDGTYKNELSMQDVYVYKSWGRYISGKEFRTTGNVMLVR